MSTNTFAELTANGQTAGYECPGDVNKVSVYIDDAETWGSGTLKMQSSWDGGTTWVDVPSASWTTGDGLLSADVEAFGRDIRFDLSGATTPSITITVKVEPVSAVVEYVNLTANGTTDVVLTRPGKLALFANGTWDSGSLTLDISPDGTLYVDTGITALTANGGGVYANAGGDHLCQLVLASVVTAADLDVYVVSIN